MTTKVVYLPGDHRVVVDGRTVRGRSEQVRAWIAGWDRARAARTYADGPAPPSVEELTATLGSVLRELHGHLPGRHDQSSHGRRRGLRPDLVKAKTVEEVAAVVAERASAAVGDTVTADFTGADVEVARQFGEGLLQGIEAYPATPLREIGTYGPGGSNSHNAQVANNSSRAQRATAFALRGGEGNEAGERYQVETARLAHGYSTSGTAVYLNTGADWQARAGIRELERQGVLRGRANMTSTPREVALHEFAHSIGKHGRPSEPEYAVGQTARKMASDAGQDYVTYVARGVSIYAASDDAELAAEAFADVMANGSKATPLSKELTAVFDTNVRGWEAEVT